MSCRHCRDPVLGELKLGWQMNLARQRVEGAGKVRVGSSYAALVVYQLPMEVASLLVAPDSVARANGGVQVQYTKDLIFHYEIIEGDKVVTWSIHGITYALVSDSKTPTQQSCMVCHAGMNDQRDFSQTRNRRARLALVYSLACSEGRR
jgi:hypothetical protein